MLIAATQAWHQHHPEARADLRRRLAHGETMLLAAHSLVECYSVLSRLPRAPRLAPPAVLDLLRTSFIEKGTVVALDPGEYLGMLRDAALSGIAGGRIYDAVIAASALAANADVILTFNVRDFTGLAPGLAIVPPAEAPLTSS